jgi:hypothetical protein
MLSSDKHYSLSVKIVNYRKESIASFDTFWVGFNWKKKSDNHNELDKSSDCFRKRKKSFHFIESVGACSFINQSFHQQGFSSTFVFID